MMNDDPWIMRAARRLPPPEVADAICATLAILVIGTWVVTGLIRLAIWLVS